MQLQLQAFAPWEIAATARPAITRFRPGDAETFPRGLDSPKSRQLRLKIFEAAEIGLAAILN